MRVSPAQSKDIGTSTMRSLNSAFRAPSIHCALQSHVHESSTFRATRQHSSAGYLLAGRLAGA
eukprot:8281854-Alexandrium_andersonii.AAC.1